MLRSFQQLLGFHQLLAKFNKNSGQTRSLNIDISTSQHLNMPTISLAKIKEKLLENKISLEKELSGFADKDKKTKDDWDTNYTQFARNGSGSQAMEEAADEVEEYSNRLPVEFSLETRLRDINLALDKIKKGTYGLCEKCEKPIPQTRLAVYPEARTCQKCRL